MESGCRSYLMMRKKFSNVVASLASLRWQSPGESGSRINAHRLELRIGADGRESSRRKPIVHCRNGPSINPRPVASVLDHASKELECICHPMTPRIGVLVSRPTLESLLGADFVGLVQDCMIWLKNLDL